ncbi:MAG: hypothetical protein KBA06_03330, partial [Saprospiraceae bacterium]|nr:hypothetical protein [Saprospiraceae bacterium]
MLTNLRMIKLSIIFIIVVVISQSGAFAQTSKVENALNAQAKFVNESAHGMLIIHRLLELYNQELNKYVDLDNYKLNNISGDDFPDDIFQDPSKLFYQDPPYLLYNTA